MKIIKKNIRDLHFAPYNPRKISKKTLDKLAKSIEHFGYIEPIIWNKRTGYVVGGNQRLQVLKELGEKEVDVVVVDLDEQQEKALNIALNKIMGDWDVEVLADLISTLDTEEIELTGFDEKELDYLSDIDNIDEFFEESDKQSKKQLHKCPKCGCVFDSQGNIIEEEK